MNVLSYLNRGADIIKDLHAATLPVSTQQEARDPRFAVPIEEAAHGRPTHTVYSRSQHFPRRS